MVGERHVGACKKALLLQQKYKFCTTATAVPQLYTQHRKSMHQVRQALGNMGFLDLAPKAFSVCEQAARVFQTARSQQGNGQYAQQVPVVRFSWCKNDSWLLPTWRDQQKHTDFFLFPDPNMVPMFHCSGHILDLKRTDFLFPDLNMVP